MTMNLPAPLSAHITVHPSAPTRDALLATTVPQAPQEASRLRLCLMRIQSQKNIPFSQSPSPPQSRSARGYTLTTVSTESNNHNFRRTGIRTRTFSVREHLTY